MIRVRFAPSPTGFLHIGGARTCLFNWIFAKRQKGEFILRIEDTDKERSKKEYLEEILNSLKWLGLDWDEIYYQSQRFNIYTEFAQKLLKENKAYLEGAAIILKIPQEEVVVEDLIRGKISFDSSTIKDQVLIKSDASPTYNFACVVDDALMKITHVIRGEDHISNTPKQIVMYEALGLKIPQFAHLPLILDKQGGRMSKRTGATAVSEYRQMGYLPEAIVNFLLLLGWSPGDNKEIISLDEAVKLFDVTKVNKTSAVFDIDKLKWMNGEYIIHSDTKKILPLIKNQLALAIFNTAEIDDKYLLRAIELYKIRIKTLLEFIELADYLFKEDYSWEEKGKEKYLQDNANKENLKVFAQNLEKLDDFSYQKIEAVCRDIMEQKKLKASGIIHPARMAISGKTKGAGLFEIMELLGKDKVIARLKKAVV